nr:MAG TPA: hypothetical protein [Inoviridae sp.]
MRILVVGKVHRAGTSKKGNAYDMTLLQCEFDMLSDSNHAGVSVCEIPVYASMMPFSAFELGVAYDFDFNMSGDLLGIEKL